MCRVLRVSPGGYYDWRGRPQSDTAQRREALVVAIKAIHADVKARYGSPRVHAELVARGKPCCANTVARPMRGHGIAAKARRKFCYSRKVVGRAMGERIDSRLVVDAPEMAVVRRLPAAGLVAHSDRGRRYASEHYQRLLGRHGIVRSMSRRANCWGNAPKEFFFGRLKKELTRGEAFETRASLSEYIEVFFNRTRRHSSSAYMAPAGYEQLDQPLTRRPPSVGESIAAFVPEDEPAA